MIVGYAAFPKGNTILTLRVIVLLAMPKEGCRYAAGAPLRDAQTPRLACREGVAPNGRHRLSGAHCAGRLRRKSKVAIATFRKGTRQ